MKNQPRHIPYDCSFLIGKIQLTASSEDTAEQQPLNITESGTVEGLSAGTKVTYTITPAEGEQIASVAVNGAKEVNYEAKTFTVGTNNLSITAEFEPVPDTSTEEPTDPSGKKSLVHQIRKRQINQMRGNNNNSNNSNNNNGSNNSNNSNNNNNRTAGILRIKQTHLDRITMEILRENQIIQTMVHRMAERTMLRLVQIQQIKAV